MKVKIVFLSLVFIIVLLSQFIPINTGFNNNEDSFNLKKIGNVTAYQEFFDFFNPTKHHLIEIITTSEELSKLDGYMQENYDKYGVYRNSRNVKADFVYKEDGVTKKELTNIGFRTNGNGSKLGLVNYDPLTNYVNLNNFKLKFSETFNDELIENDNRSLFGMERLNLKFNKTAVKQNSEVSSYINEVMGYLTYNEAGVIAPLASNVNLALIVDNKYINMGIYTMIENIDQQFINKRFSKQENDGNLYKCLYRNGIFADLSYYDNLNIGIKDEERNIYPTYDLKTNKKNPNHDELLDFIYKINTLEGSKLKQYLDTKVKIKDFIKYTSVSYLIGNIDDFRFRGNNYYLYFASKSKQVYFIPQDLDHVFGEYGDLGYYGENFALIDAYSDWTLMGQKNTLLTKTLLNKENSTFGLYCQLYEHHIELNVKTSANFETYQELFNQVKKLYGDISQTKNVRTTTPRMGIPSQVEKFFANKVAKVGDL